MKEVDRDVAVNKGEAGAKEDFCSVVFLSESDICKVCREGAHRK